jgi:hypothetical protein
MSVRDLSQPILSTFSDRRVNIFADFKKGFDLVDHNVIIKELTLLGTHPSIIRWIKN